MRIVVFCINYDPEIISTGLYATGMAEYFSEKGHDTHVITALPYYPAWRTFDGWRRPFWKARTSADGARIVHCPIYVPRVPTGARRILHYISYALSALPVALWKALRVRPDVVMLIAPSLITAPVALATARLGGAVSWLHIQDFEVEAAFATGLLKGTGRAARMARGYERAMLSRFDRVSTISAPMIARLAEKGVAPDAQVEFRNWADLARVTPLTAPPALKSELGITTRHVALYSGNLANKQGLEIIPAMARLLQHRDDLTIAICGDGPMRETLVSAAADLPMVRFFPLQPVDRLGELVGMADIHLLPQIAGAADLVLPSKLTNMLASGRPVVATTRADTALGAEIGDAGVLVPPGDPKALADAVAALLDDPERRARMGAVARAQALARWDKTAILDRLIATFEETVAGKATGRPR